MISEFFALNDEAIAIGTKGPGDPCNTAKQASKGGLMRSSAARKLAIAHRFQGYQETVRPCYGVMRYPEGGSMHMAVSQSKN